MPNQNNTGWRGCQGQFAISTEAKARHSRILRFFFSKKSPFQGDNIIPRGGDKLQISQTNLFCVGKVWVQQKCLGSTERSVFNRKVWVQQKGLDSTELWQSEHANDRPVMRFCEFAEKSKIREITMGILIRQNRGNFECSVNKLNSLSKNITISSTCDYMVNKKPKIQTTRNIPLHNKNVASDSFIKNHTYNKCLGVYACEKTIQLDC